ncbi:putative START-like domain superfamily protein [Helianthus annuus]|nr:putative START-like domain superfamily protein [Helianthus annuus]
MEIDVPVSVAYNCYLDREAIPKWMPFISSVKVLIKLLLLCFNHWYCCICLCHF